MSRLQLLLLALASLGASAGGCSDQLDCQPGRVYDCTCRSGDPGIQECNDQGSALGECRCLQPVVDALAGSSAGGADGTATECIPGESEACECDDETVSSRVCFADGSGYGACDCQFQNDIDLAVARLAQGLTEHNARCVGMPGDLITQLDPNAPSPSVQAEAGLRAMIVSALTVFNQEETEPCLDTLAASCGFEALIGVPYPIEYYCPSLFSGIQGEGEGCVFHAECETGFCRYDFALTCGTCASRSPDLGDLCAVGFADCPADQFCGDGWVCHPRAQAGANCASKVCAEGFQCAGVGASAVCVPNPVLSESCEAVIENTIEILSCEGDAFCNQGVCSSVLQEGEPCNDDQACAAGLHCATYLAEPLCKAVIEGDAVGNSCTYSCGHPLATGLFCAGAPGGTCQAITPLAEGERCDGLSGESGILCAGQFSTSYCDARSENVEEWVCAPRPSLGEPCEPYIKPCNVTNSACVPGPDDMWVCGPYPLEGEPCLDVCASNLSCRPDENREFRCTSPVPESCE